MNKCLNCGKEISNNSKYCSNSCQVSYNRKLYLEKLENGEVTGLKGKFGISNHIRNYLLEINNYKCQICGWGEINKYTNIIHLEIHHIDGNHTNNSLNNLQVLCPNCHSLTENYKNHNKNGTRSNRGKS